MNIDHHRLKSKEDFSIDNYKGARDNTFTGISGKPRMNKHISGSFVEEVKNA